MDKRKIKKQKELEHAAKVAEKKAKKEKLGKTGKLVLVGIGIAAMVLSVTSMACSGFINMKNGPDYKLTGGVAAEVNGLAVTEDTVTKQIMAMRSSGDYDDDADWAQYLVDQGLTPESLREYIVEDYINQLLMQNAIKEYNIQVSDAELNDAWNQTVAGYESEDAFIELLEQIGYTKDSYKESMAGNIAQQKLRDTVAPKNDVSDEDIVAYYNDNVEMFNDARKSSHILFAVNEDGSNKDEQRAAAQEVLDKLNAGEITFEDAAKEHSDDGSGAQGGNVGWDRLTTFVPEYQQALSQLGVGEMSGIIESQFGFHIIMCTDAFMLDQPASSADELPDEFVDYIRNICANQGTDEAYANWQKEYRESADIHINPMPEDVPYNVSLDGVVPSTPEDKQPVED